MKKKSSNYRGQRNKIDNKAVASITEKRGEKHVGEEQEVIKGKMSETEITFISWKYYF